jgi:hypothetical protein
MNQIWMTRYTFFLLIACCCYSPTTSAQEAKKEKGFQSIFDGTLKNWDGDSIYWRVENGELVGEVLPSTLLKRNSFIIWRGGTVADFELKLEYWVSSLGNSGVNYRSEEIDSLPRAMRGYQCDIEGRDRHTGQNYEERGRTFLAKRGEKVELQTGQPPKVVEKIDTPEALQAKVKKEDWNEIHIIAKGNHIWHYINGVLMSEVIDNDATKRKLQGLIGVQVHVGPPMIIKYRNIRLKMLKN